MQRLIHGGFGQVRSDGATAVTGTWAPPVELDETDDALVLQVELPGVSKDAVTVEFHEHTLRLSGERTRVMLPICQATAHGVLWRLGYARSHGLGGLSPRAEGRSCS